MNEGKLNAKVCRTIPNLQCVIHREELCCKVLKINDVLKRIVEITNFIRARGLNHRQFGSLHRDLECDYGDLLHYIEIRWLSCRMLLRSFFDLRNEIFLFLEMKE
jgi:hypothetical protein